MHKVTLKFFSSGSCGKNTDKNSFECEREKLLKKWLILDSDQLRSVTYYFVRTKPDTTLYLFLDEKQKL